MGEGKVEVGVQVFGVYLILSFSDWLISGVDARFVRDASSSCTTTLRSSFHTRLGGSKCDVQVFNIVASCIKHQEASSSEDPGADDNADVGCSAKDIRVPSSHPLAQ